MVKLSPRLKAAALSGTARWRLLNRLYKRKDGTLYKILKWPTFEQQQAAELAWEEFNKQSNKPASPEEKAERRRAYDRAYGLKRYVHLTSQGLTTRGTPRKRAICAKGVL